ncbi:hypothetical protein BGZ83_006914 [Gryganskiella cystojenkinii]|nr:hypothetical protein BGZ83_006914 [Gryganskiella cystojenkinii]
MTSVQTTSETAPHHDHLQLGYVLEIPELLLLIAGFVNRRNRSLCSRVNRSWRRCLLPSVYEHVNVKGNDDDEMCPSLELLTRFGYFIHYLTVDMPDPAMYSGFTINPSAAELFPRVRRLEVRVPGTIREVCVWVWNCPGATSIQVLRVRKEEIENENDDDDDESEDDENEDDENEEDENESDDDDENDDNDPEHDDDQDEHVESEKKDEKALNWHMDRCRQLTELEISGDSLSDEELASALVRPFERITISANEFGDQSFLALSSVADRLTVLDLRACPDMTPQGHRSILSSCPLLVEAYVVTLDIDDFFVPSPEGDNGGAGELVISAAAVTLPSNLRVLHAQYWLLSVSTAKNWAFNAQLEIVPLMVMKVLEMVTLDENPDHRLFKPECPWVVTAKKWHEREIPGWMLHIWPSLTSFHLGRRRLRQL